MTLVQQASPPYNLTPPASCSFFYGTPVKLRQRLRSSGRIGRLIVLHFAAFSLDIWPTRLSGSKLHFTSVRYGVRANPFTAKIGPKSHFEMKGEAQPAVGKKSLVDLVRPSQTLVLMYTAPP